MTPAMELANRTAAKVSAETISDQERDTEGGAASGAEVEVGASVAASDSIAPQRRQYRASPRFFAPHLRQSAPDRLCSDGSAFDMPALERRVDAADERC